MRGKGVYWKLKEHSLFRLAKQRLRRDVTDIYGCSGGDKWAMNKLRQRLL